MKQDFVCVQYIQTGAEVDTHTNELILFVPGEVN
jgi:hypothetical protein